MRLSSFLLALTFAATAVAPCVAAPDYDYDSAQPLNLTFGKTRTPSPGVTIREMQFVSTTGHVVKGEIIAGNAKKPRPGVLFLHWLGEPKTTNHTEFEDDAIAVAKRGGTSILIDLLWSDPKWFDGVGKDADADIRQAEAQVIDMRRALDVLERQPNVDAKRLALVGHDFGAMFGALLLGVDHRPKVFAAMAAVPTMSEWYLLGKKAADGYEEKVGTLDILGGLRASKADAYLFQFATKDHYVPRPRSALLFDAAPLPKGEFFYDADHDLATPKAGSDRRAWLIAQLF